MRQKETEKRKERERERELGRLLFIFSIPPQSCLYLSLQTCSIDVIDERASLGYTTDTHTNTAGHYWVVIPSAFFIYRPGGVWEGGVGVNTGPHNVHLNQPKLQCKSVREFLFGPPQRTVTLAWMHHLSDTTKLQFVIPQRIQTFCGHVQGEIYVKGQHAHLPTHTHTQTQRHTTSTTITTRERFGNKERQRDEYSRRLRIFPYILLMAFIFLFCYNQ